MKSTDFVQLDRAMLKPQMRAISSREAKERCIHINSALPRKQVSSMFEKLPEISNLHSVDPYQFSKSFYDRPPDVQPYCHATGLQAGEKSWRSMAKQRRDWGQLYEPSLAAGRKALPPVMMYTGAKAPGMHKTHSCLFKPQCPLPDRDSFFQGQDFETIAILPTVSVSRQQAVVDDLDIKLRVAEMSRNSKNQLSKLETIVRQKTERDARFTLLKGKTYAMECRMLQDTITENVESQNYDEMSKVKRRDMQVFLDKSRKGLVFLNVIPTNLELASV